MRYRQNLVMQGGCSCIRIKGAGCALLKNQRNRLRAAQAAQAADAAAAMHAVMSVAVETVNAVVGAALQTVDRMGAVAAEQLRSAHAQQQLQARLAGPLRSAHKSPPMRASGAVRALTLAAWTGACAGRPPRHEQPGDSSMGRHSPGMQHGTDYCFLSMTHR